jgi:hypothetical protein
MENGAALLCWAPGGNALVLALGGKLHALYDKPVTQAQAQAQARARARCAGAAGGGTDAAAAAEATRLPLAEWGRLCNPKDWQQLTQPQSQQDLAAGSPPLQQGTFGQQPPPGAGHQIKGLASAGDALIVVSRHTTAAAMSTHEEGKEGTSVSSASQTLAYY